MSIDTTDRGWITTTRFMHAGVKGMRWGVRKKTETSSSNSSSSGVKGLEHFSKSQAASMSNVAKKMEQGYGFKVHEFVPITTGERIFAIVNPKAKGEEHNSIHVNSDSQFMKTELNKAHKLGWLAPAIAGRKFDATITHEAAHGMFHANDSSGKGVKRTRQTSMAPIRRSAWKKAEEQARKDGDISSDKSLGPPMLQMGGKISRYAKSSPFIEEYEAEAFTAYHWSPNPPKFVDTFMNDIHKSMGKDVKPFSGRDPHVS